uniref:NADH dehydrogenase subunit 2 n=1 Tax=Litomosoides sigmodontis TaxID=42156 RepID=A0A347YCA3_LITSI|nr:NADH dehydrogenase subunit 2 [Litomosoides sigmodontis]
MLFFVFLFFLFLSFVNFCVLDSLVWWSIFVVCTFFFVFFIKNVGSYNYLVSYYIVQEVCGYYFLVFDSWKLQFMFLMLKCGCAPFHFWLFSVISGIDKWFVLWFLTIQKLPYLFVLVNFCSDFFFFIIFFGMVVCYLQFFLLRGYRDMLLVISTESFNWLLLVGLFSFNELFFYVFFYYFIFFLVVFYVYDCDYGSLSYEILFVLFNVPMSITFFLKVLLVFGSWSFVGIYYYLLMILMPLMSLGVGYFFFVYSMSGYNYGTKYYDYFFYIFFCFSFLSFF